MDMDLNEAIRIAEAAYADTSKMSLTDILRINLAMAVIAKEYLRQLRTVGDIHID